MRQPASSSQQNGTAVDHEIVVVRLDHEADQSFRSLDDGSTYDDDSDPDGDSILVFTPSPHGVRTATAAPTAADPLAGLIQAFGTVHPRAIEHRQFYAIEGLQPPLLAALEVTSNVVVVICEPIGLSLSDTETNMRHQHAIAQALVDAYFRVNEGIDTHPLAIFYIGTRPYTPPARAPICLRIPSPAQELWFPLVRKLLCDRST